jgi:hypothetical protein
MTELRFDDIAPIEEKVYLGGEEYVLRETSGHARVRYDNARIACHEYQEGKLARVHDIADLEPLLVSLCLFKNGEPVPESWIRGLPSRVQTALYTRARKISGLDETVQSLEKQKELIEKQLAEAKEKEQDVKNS